MAGRRRHALLPGQHLAASACRPGARLHDDLPTVERAECRLVYLFPELYVTESGPTERRDDQPEKRYSLYQAAVAEVEAQRKQRELQRFRIDLAAINARAR